jgi:hypothetical protein
LKSNGKPKLTIRQNKLKLSIFGFDSPKNRLFSCEMPLTKKQPLFFHGTQKQNLHKMPLLAK